MIYKYSELKGKIKVGDKVKAVEGKGNACDELNDGGIGIITEINESSFRISGCKHWYSGEFYLEILEKTLDDLVEGDEVVREDSIRKTVLFVLKKGLYVLSDTYKEQPEVEHLKVDNIWSSHELQERGFTFYTPPKDDTIEVTIEEIAKLKNTTPDKIRVKE